MLMLVIKICCYIVFIPSRYSPFMLLKTNAILNRGIKRKGNKLANDDLYTYFEL